MRLIARVILFVSVIPSMAQVKPIHTIKLSQPVKEVYVDRPGDLYLRLATGAIQKFDVDGKLISEFKPKENITLFEPRDGARAFAWSKEARWYSYAYFGNLNKTLLNEEYAIDPVLACSSGDKNLWVYDQADYSLKKINTEQSTVVVEVFLPEVFHNASLENLTLREYQTFLFLLYPGNGIYIFSSMGTHLKTLETDVATYFNFLGEELYFPRKGKLVFYNLFDTTTREIALEPSVKFTLLTDVRTYRIFTDRVEIFPANP